MSEFFTSESTGRANQNIDEILRDNMETAMKERGERFGTIGPSPPNFDKFMDSDEGKAIMDMVIGSGSAMPLHLVRKGVGKLATNLMTPRNYDVSGKISNFIQNIKEHGIRKTMKRIAKDEGILDMKTGINYGGKNRTVSSVVDPNRDLPFRLMFDLKPRYSAAYKKIPKSYETGGGPFNVVRQVEFNPETVAGHRLLEEIQSTYRGPGHSVMGNYKRTPKSSSTDHLLNNKNIEYEDLWNLGLNPGEAKEMLGYSRLLTEAGKKHKRKDLIGSLILRKLAESITNPVLIKGQVAPSQRVRDIAIGYKK